MIVAENVHTETQGAAYEPRWLPGRLLREFCRTEVGRHLVNARKEFLLALRACIDARIRHLEELTEEPRKIEVE